MRLPFGLGRRSSPGNGASGGSADASSPTVSRSATTGSGSVPAPSRAWASLPPIQRAAGSMPLVAAPAAFAGSLPGTQGLPPVVQQLGHEVSALATPGLVVARVRAVEQASAGSIPAPVQRRARATAQRQAAAAQPEPFAAAEPAPAPVAVAPVVARTTSASAPTSSSSSTAAPVVSRSAVDDAAGDDDEVSAASVAAPDMAPVRSLPTVSRSAIRVPDRPLTSAASVVRPVAQRSHAGHSHAGPSTDGAQAPAASLPAPSGGMRRAPSNPALARGATPTTVSRQAATSSDTPSGAHAPASAPAPSSLPTLASGSSRRGVGEPTSLPPTARPVGSSAASPSAPVVSRSTMAGAMPLAASGLRTTIQRQADSEDEGDEGEAPVQRSVPSVSSSRSSFAPSLPSLPVLTVSRSARADAAAGDPALAAAAASSWPTGGSAAAGSSPGRSGPSGPSGPSGTTLGTPIQRSPGPAIRPIAAHNPIRPAVALQRDADADAGDGDGDGDGDAPLPSPWWAPAADRPPASHLPTQSAGLAAGSPVQRSAFGTPTQATAAWPTAANRSAAGSPSRTSSAVQRSARTSGLAPRLPIAVAPTTAASHAAPASTRGGAPDWSAPGTTVTFPAGLITGAPVVQTSRSGTPTYPPPSPASPTLQREGGTTSSATTTSATTTSATPARTGHSERELDDLARQLFGRIRTRLRADLLQDREAAGFTFDNV